MAAVDTTCKKHLPKADPYQCGGNTSGYLVYRDAFRTFFSGSDYNPVEVGFRMSNAGIKECSTAFADALTECVEAGRIRGRHALPPGMGHAVAAAGTPFEEGIVDDFVEVVRIAVHSVFGTCNNAVLPFWHAQQWSGFLWNALMRLMRDGLAGSRPSVSPMAKEWYLRTSYDLLIRLTRAVHPYLVNPSLTLDSPGVHGFLSVFDSQHGHSLLKKRPVPWCLAVLTEEVANEVLLAMKGPDARQSDPFYFDGVFGWLIGMRPWRGLVQTVATGRADTGLGLVGLSTRAAQTCRHHCEMLHEQLTPGRYAVHPDVLAPRAAKKRGRCEAEADAGGGCPSPPMTPLRQESDEYPGTPQKAARTSSDDAGGTPPYITTVTLKEWVRERSASMRTVEAVTNTRETRAIVQRLSSEAEFAARRELRF